MPLSDEVRVIFVAETGESHEAICLRSATKREIARRAAGLCGYRLCRLAFGDLPALAADMPLWEATDEAVINVSSLDLSSSLIDLIKARRWSEAGDVLDSHADPEAVARLRDESGDSALSWAAYRAGWSLEGAAVVRKLLAVAPSDARYRSPGFGMLPLHDAAWGHASPKIAALLCLAYPEAVLARNPAGETPHQMASYLRATCPWPPPEELLQNATAISESNPPPPFQVGAMCALSDKEVRKACRAGPMRRRLYQTLPRRVSRPAEVPLDGALLDEAARFVQEFRQKDQGRFAGMRAIRHDRCGFKVSAIVAVGADGLVHRLRLHVARGAADSARRGHVQAKWPSKAAANRERRLERETKMAHLIA